MTEQKVNRKKKKHFLKRIAMVLSLVLSFNILFPSLGGLIAMAEEPKVKEINNFQDFFILAAASQNFDYEGWTIKLNVDLDLEDQEIKNMLKEYNVTHLTVGTKDRPFKGTFDGQNHFIKDLVYDPGIIKDPNSGLFSFTDGATIKDLRLIDASIECVYQGGIIVGHAKNTQLENITVLNSKLKISPANNVVSLITNLGFSGGGIAGIMENSTMYNCEISGTEVVNNNTSGVTGVGGEGLYMGGLVGWMEDSTIEYSRVRSNYVNEAGNEVIKQSVVRNDYDIAVGALGGKSVYAGGIVGGVNTTDAGKTRIIDCFSTADVSFYAANYVAVGSGIAGYGGGITGALRGNSQIERCHYAGNIHSKQYNAILVIPIIQTDVNISGLSNVNKGTTSVTNSYFKRSSSVTNKNLYAVGTRGDTEEASAKSDDVYADQSFWESKGYDMNGTIQRDTGRINKWVMDYDLDIPVHGETVCATFNFPDAAKVTIDKTALVNTAVSTEDPYLYATQGIHPRGDQEVTLTVEAKDSNPDDKIEEYRFDGWHKKDNILSNYTEDIQDLDCTGSTPVSKDKKYTYKFTELNQIDNSLFIADMKARVAFHEVDGVEISSDYYKYEQALNNETPKKIPEKSMFYGWTNIPNPENNDGGYPAITSSKLEELKQQDAIYQAGDPVEKAMDLYPIFKNNLANIKTEFEGHELDDSDLSSLRKNVGETIIGFDDQGAYIDIKGAEADGNLPDGYRFLGWYRQDNTEQGATQEICVSKEQKYYVPDVSEPVTYVARLEYRLDYFVSLKQKHDSGSKYQYDKFYTQWVKYKTPFDVNFANGIVPKDYDHKLDHWSERLIDEGDACTDQNDIFDYNTSITEPHNLFAHWLREGIQDDNISIISDFPNAAKLEIDSSEIGNMKFVATPYSGYHFHFWAEEQRDDNHTTWLSELKENSWNTGHNHSHLDEFLAEAHLAAEINFYMKDGTPTKQVLRTYKSTLFKDADETQKYIYPIYDGPIDEKYNLTEAASPQDAEMLNQAGKDHEFLGWIQVKSEGSQNGIEKDGYVWKQIYNVADDAFCTSNVAAALPYLVSKDTKVIETMDLYPVYTRYNIETTTNIHEVGTLPVGVNHPKVPAYTLTKEADAALGVSTITVTASSDVDPVMTGDETKYKLVGMKCTNADGTETNLWKQAVPGTNSYSFTMEVKAGESYKFTAIYSPVVLVYHLDDQQTSHVIKNINSPVGKMPVTQNPAEPNAYMAAWTKTQPANGGWCHTCQTVDEIQQYQIVTDKTVVKQSMDLYPVFVKSSVTVNSNIDAVLNKQGTNPETIRFLQNENNQFSLVAKNCKGYVFKGWYTDYKDDHNPGKLFSEQATQALTKDQVLSNTTYTAVYAEAIDINYHDFFGNILYTAKTTKGEDRTFVQTVEYEPGKEQEIPVDIDAFTLIDENIHQIEQQQHTKIRFVEWRLESQNADGNNHYTSWKDFKNNKITEEVNLYPVAYEVGFYTPAPETAFTGIDYSVQQKEDGSKQLDAFFTGAYDDAEIKITTKEHTWERNNLNAEETTDPSKKHTVRGLEGIHTDVYMTGLPDQDGNATYLKASDGTVDTNQDGIAIHKLLGSLIIKKDYADQAGPNETLVFKIQKMNGDAPEGEAVSIPMTLTDGQGECQIRLPIGDYQVSEDHGWSWRDDVTGVEHNGAAVDSKAAVAVKMNVLAPETLVFHNARNNQNWFSDSNVAHNVFGKKPAGGETK